MLPSLYIFVLLLIPWVICDLLESIIDNKHFFQLLALETTMSSSKGLFLKSTFYNLEVHWIMIVVKLLKNLI